MNEPLCIGIIGTGWPALQHSRASRHVDGLPLVAACDADAERRERFAAEFAPKRVFAGTDELLAEGEVDAVIVCLPNFLHFPVTMAALAAGKHVLCEKPPTLRLAEVETIRDEARRRGLTYAFGRQFRFESGMIAAREAVRSGRLGRVYFGRGQWLRLRGTPGGVGGWFTDQARSGGGAIIDLGVHSLDAVWYLAGCPRLLSVTAHTGSYFPGCGDVEDTGFAFLRFEGGLIVSLEIAWSMNFGSDGAEASEWWGLEAAHTRLHGDAATLQISPPMLFRGDGGSLPIGPREPDRYESLPSPQPAFARQLEDFARAIRTGSAPTNDVDQAVELMKMIDGIYESSARGREVRSDERG